MKNLKKMVSTALAAIMITAGLALPSYASDTNEIVPYAALCPACGTGEMIKQPTEYGSWFIVGSIRCTHGDIWATDEIQQRTVTTVYTCNFCGSSDVTVTTEERIVHHG